VASDVNDHGNWAMVACIAFAYVGMDLAVADLSVNAPTHHKIVETPANVFGLPAPDIRP
jgi:hypothetical protein